eukprot:TRINITY_DN39111_c0_g1_i1.p1 TRINITY_DN39111_c0_g1~~TRINITY_DN39111_c0_g1_i1.p1  ORF type:complete len:186 (+),score=29.06 TRINITY_DN39111_c0_g1_i1:138-695(+)
MPSTALAHALLSADTHDHHCVVGRGRRPLGLAHRATQPRTAFEDAHDWQTFGRKCQPVALAYAAGQLRSASRRAIGLANVHLESKFWDGLQEIMRDAQPVESSLSSTANWGKPTADDLSHLDWALYRADKMHREVMELMDARVQADEISGDAAMRVADAFGKVHDYANFLTAEAYACVEPEDLTR